MDGGAYPHIPDKIRGAERIDPDDIEDVCQGLPEERTILTYCTCDNDEISAKVAYFLRKRGHDAYAIEGGLPAWREAGCPVQEDGRLPTHNHSVPSCRSGRNRRGLAVIIWGRRWF